MDAAPISLAQKEDRERGIDQEDIFHRMVLFLPTITVRLCRKALGADDPPFGPVMGKRGDADAVAGTAAPGAASSSSGTTTVATSASETPKRCAKAMRERAGASPRVCSAARRAGR